MNETTLPSWWTEEDDQILIEGKRKELTYQEIAEELGGRTAKSVRGRWVRIKDTATKEEWESSRNEDVNHRTVIFPPGRITTLSQLLKIGEVDLWFKDSNGVQQSFNEPLAARLEIGYQLTERITIGYTHRSQWARGYPEYYVDEFFVDYKVT